MKRVHYANGSFVTGDTIADTLMHYASMLAKAQDADEIDVVAIGDDGEREQIRLLIGPTSQIMLESLPGSDDLTDTTVVDELTARCSVMQKRLDTRYQAAPVVLDDGFVDPF